jgi:hypothetical protein
MTVSIYNEIASGGILPGLPFVVKHSTGRIRHNVAIEFISAKKKRRRHFCQRLQNSNQTLPQKRRALSLHIKLLFDFQLTVRFTRKIQERLKLIVVF